MTRTAKNAWFSVLAPAHRPRATLVCFAYGGGNAAAFRAWTRHAPADDGCFDHAARFVIVPTTVGEVAGEWQLIGSAVIFAKDLDGHTRRRGSRTIEFSQSSLACCHLIYSPKKCGAPTPLKNPPRSPPAAGNHSAGMR